MRLGPHVVAHCGIYIKIPVATNKYSKYSKKIHKVRMEELTHVIYDCIISVLPLGFLSLRLW